MKSIQEQESAREDPAKTTLFIEANNFAQFYGAEVLHHRDDGKWYIHHDDGVSKGFDTYDEAAGEVNFEDCRD